MLLFSSFYPVLLIFTTSDLSFFIKLATQHTIIQLYILQEHPPNNFKIELMLITMMLADFYDVLNSYQALFCRYFLFVIKVIILDKYYYPCFLGEKIEAQKNINDLFYQESSSNDFPLFHIESLCSWFSFIYTAQKGLFAFHIIIKTFHSLEYISSASP